MERVPSFHSNLSAFLIGFIAFGTHFFTKWFSFSEIGVALLGGYFLLSAYHGWLFGVSRLGNLFSLLIVWLIPFTAVTLIFFCLIYGLVVSIPKTIYSGYHWISNRKKKQNFTTI